MRGLGAIAIGFVCACAAGQDGPDRPANTIADDGTSTATGTTASETTAATADDTPMSCVPGQQIECACPGGAKGAQACNADGTGYEPCECPGGGTTTGTAETSGGPTTSPDSADGTTTGTAAGCGDPTLKCEECVQCAVEDPCKEQYAACSMYDLCTAANACVMMCGYNDACFAMCSPDDMMAAQAYLDLGNCVMQNCPQCLNP